MPHDVPIIIITMCIVGPEKNSEVWMGGVEMPLMLITHCALMVIYVDCWTWKRCWGVNEGGIVFGKNTHWLLGDHPCKLFFSQPTPTSSENKRILKKWAKSCWNNADDHYNVFFPHPNPSSTSAEKERLTFRRVGQNRLNTGDHCTMLFSQPTFLASSVKIST